MIIFIFSPIEGPVRSRPAKELKSQFNCFAQRNEGNQRPKPLRWAQSLRFERTELRERTMQEMQEMQVLKSCNNEM
jgi:hypothetical protein